MSKLKQTDRILRYMDEFGSITQIDAIRDCGVMRLASRINDLRNAGYVIITEYVEGRNRYGEKTRFARYRKV